MEPTPADLAHIVEDLRPLAIRLDTVKEDADNARLHPNKNVEAIVASITARGFDQPIVVRKEDMVISKGHGRCKALRAMGFEWVPAVVVTESRTEAIQRGIADNRASDLATTDYAKLMELIDQVTSEGYTAVGFSDDDIAAIMVDADSMEADLQAAEEGTEAAKEEADEAPRGAPGSPVIKANVIFDTSEQQKRWHAWTRELRSKYPDEPTIGARIDAHIRSLS